MDNNDLEKGLIIGSICSRLEEQGVISFTNDMAYDDEFLVLAKQLITEFDLQDEYNYFSDFVQARLVEMEGEINGSK